MTAALALVVYADARRLHLVAAGVTLAAAFWLKYNAAAYALPVAAAAWARSHRTDHADRPVIVELGWIALGFGLATTSGPRVFRVERRTHDWRLATIDYNLRYSNETYESRLSVLRYLVAFPFERARIDAIWFLGGLGVLLLASQARSNRIVPGTLAWLLAAVVSIAVNGSRSLPNYFVQANPALALAASAGLSSSLVSLLDPLRRCCTPASGDLARWRDRLCGAFVSVASGVS